MRLSRALGMALVSTAMLISGCASSDTLHLSREPVMPEMAVIKAAETGPYYRNISIQDVQGAPEFHLFDGGGVITTRPTRKQVFDIYNYDLKNSELLAASRASSEYMLYVDFKDLHGPDVWVGSNKRASARIVFNLVRWRSGEVIKRQETEVAYLAESPGVTAREVFSGGMGLAAGVGSGYAITKAYEGLDGVRVVAAEALGAGAGMKVGVDAGERVLLALNAGAIPRNRTTPLSSTSEIGGRHQPPHCCGSRLARFGSR